MSERWSWCSEFIYCEKCAAALNELARKNWPVSPYANGRGLAKFPTDHIAGGFGGGLSPEEPKADMWLFAEELHELICHPVRLMAFYDDDTHEFFGVRPKDA